MSKAITILEDMTKCTGCGACKNICPVDAIDLKEGFRTFLYPTIDEKKCINCNKCKKICPINYYDNNNDNKPIIIASQADNAIRAKSSSGGMYALFAEFIIKEKNGTVFCTCMEDNLNVHFREITSYEDIHKGSDSKYVQSNTEYIFRTIKKRLTDGKAVLFVGCPCQVAGLHNYLGKEYDNLYSIDLLCHGVPSPRMLKDYLSEKADYDRISTIKFRDKNIGWRSDVMTIHMKNNTIVRNYMNQNDEYQLAFQHNLDLRSSCENCPFCSFPRIGDVSMGDFWFLWDICPLDWLGTSILFVNNPKGQKMIENIKGKFSSYKKMDMPVENIRNRINSFMPPNPSKNLFFDLYPKESFCSSVRIAMKDTVDNNINREKERKKVMEEQNAGKTIFNNIGDLGLGEGASITEIVRRMPTNSTLCQVQGNFNQPISDTPVPYGVLTIVKTTDYFVQIIFTRMTVGNTPQIYQAQWKDNRVYSWSRFVSEEDLIAFKEEIREELDSIKNNIPIF